MALAGITSESDSNTIIASEERRDLSYYFFSLTTDINRASKNPRVPVPFCSGLNYSDRDGVRVLFFFASGCLSIPSGLQGLAMATMKEGNQSQMWEFIRTDSESQKQLDY